MRRYLPLLLLALGTAVCGGSAFGLNQVIRALVALPEGADLPDLVVDGGPPTPPADGAAVDAEAVGSPPGATAGPTRSKQDWIGGILARNIFDSSAIGRESEGPSDATLTDLNVKLIGTVVAAPARYSAALIVENRDGAVPLSYGIEDLIQDAVIQTIEIDRVTLRRSNGTIETLTLTAVASTPPAAAPATPTTGEEEGGVTKLSETSYQIERGVVDRYLGDLDALSRMGRAIPHRGPDGEVDGYRLSGVRRRSIGDQLGIKNGDIVHSVNGQSLSSLESAMSAYQGLSQGSNFTFEVTRRGERVTLSYQVK